MTETVKGFKDYLGEEAEKKEKVKEILIKNFKIYGFEPTETPIVEYEEFVRGENSGDEAVSDIFKLEDKGKRKLALRYELTFPLKRISKNQKLPYKRYQIGEVFRDEPVTGNRLREFTQADADIIGSTLKDDAEIIALTSRALNELGIKFKIYFNNRKLLNEILESLKIKNKEETIRILDKLDKKTEKEVKEELKKFKAEKVLEIIKDKKKCQKFENYKEILEVEKYCELYDVDVEFLPSLARGLSYYNGSVFEVKSEIKETITGGGSYIFNNIQSTGISFGIERLTQLAKIKLDKKKVLIISIEQDKEVIKLAEKLRSLGIICQIIYGKVSKALEYANSKKIDKVIFVGKEEVKKKKFKVRDMKTGKESFVSDLRKI